MTRSLRELGSRDNELKSSRESEARAHDMIEGYSMEYLNPLDIPPGVKKEGYSYYWACTNIRGEAVYDVEALMRKRWTPVPADRAPNYAHDPLGRNSYSAKYIATKDLLLMERPEIYLEREKAAFNQLNYNKVKSLTGVRDSYGNMTSPGMFTSNRINSF